MHSHHDHLVRRSNGTFHFRLLLPASLQRSFGKREVHHSLKTKKRRVAIPRANQLYRSYMKMKHHQEEDILHDFQVELTDGTKVHIKHDDPEEERKHLQAVLAAKESRISKGAAKRNLQDFLSPEQGRLSDDLSDLVTAYLEDTKDSVTSRTQTEKKGALGVYQDLFDTVDHSSANNFSDILKKLPPGFKKDLDLVKLSEQDHNKTLSPKTHNKYVGFLSAFNTWLMRRGHLDKNYFSGLKMKKTTQKHTEREPFTPEEIRVLLDSTSGLDGFKYWLPRLALYTGCRINELSQLYLDDVQEIDGILCLKITDKSEGQHLKNLSSKRVVPIHPDIAEDLMWYLSDVGHLRVFPELTWTKASYYGGLSSKWFGRYRKTIGIDKPFHSLRHTFASSLLSNEVDSRIIGELLGHAESGETGRYTGKRPVGQLLEAIETLKF